MGSGYVFQTRRDVELTFAAFVQARRTGAPAPTTKPPGVALGRLRFRRFQAASALLRLRSRSPAFALPGRAVVVGCSPRSPSRTLGPRLSAVVTSRFPDRRRPRTASETCQWSLHRSRYRHCAPSSPPAHGSQPKPARWWVAAQWTRRGPRRSAPAKPGPSAAAARFREPGSAPFGTSSNAGGRR